MSILTTVGLCKNYGRIKAVKDVNIQMEEGDVFGLIGPKGAGKSTILHMLMDYIRPTKGTASILGMDCRENSREIKKSVGYLPSEIRYYPNMKVSKILDYSISFYDDIDDNYVDKLCTYFQIHLDKRFRQLSLNGKKRLAFVNALIHKPRLLLLDDPFAGLTPTAQQRFLEIMEELQGQGVAILYAGQNLWEIEDLCDSVAILHEGEVVEFKEVEREEMPRGKLIRLRVDGDIQELAMSLGAEEFMKKDGVISFCYYSDMDRLIKSLSKYNVHDIQVEDIPLEKAFESYQEQDSEVATV